MKRLGFANAEHVESEDFSSYSNMFCDGLTKEQAQLIDLLFTDKLLVADEVVLEEAE
jgi:hypothetical protein